MSRILPIALAILLGCPGAAAAHRLDEYLQGTRLGLGPGGVTIELDLTPGVSVAPRIFALIDRDRDGQIDPQEIEAYARSVVEDLTLVLDGRSLPLTLRRADSPSWPEMRDGAGTIRLEVSAAAVLDAGADHRVHYANAHEPEMSVYLANALLPSTRSVVITAQRRDRRQRQFDIDVTVVEERRMYGWLALQSVAFVALLAYRGRRRRAA